MEVEIISKTCIKPYSPTPNHLKIYKLSLLDQIHVPSYYFTAILFYHLNKGRNGHLDTDANSKRSMLLKHSLAKTLTHFYPLAGKIKDDFSIDCDEEGAYYIEARALNNSSLEEYLNQPVLPSLTEFLPEMSPSPCAPGSHVAMFQETTFACGGIVLGICLLHSVVDGVSMSSFLKSWAAMARNPSEEVMVPDFDSQLLFPQIDPFPAEALSRTLLDRIIKIGKVTRRRFVFNSQAITNLKANVTCSTLSNISRVEVVSIFLIRRVMAAMKVKSGAHHQPMVVFQAVDLRRRATPPLPQRSMGNMIYMATSTLHETGETELSDLVQQMRESIAKIDGSFVENLKGKDGVLKLCEVTEYVDNSLSNQLTTLSSSGVDFMILSSWCNFGLYDIDFGWGKPLWVTCAGPNESQSVYLNMLMLLDTRTDRGIEALVTLGKEEIANLEADKELLAYASIEPSPLTFNGI